MTPKRSSSKRSSPPQGFEPNNEYLKSQLVPGEPFWA